jgi:4'-phosphopantetheinyl transferase
MGDVIRMRADVRPGGIGAGNFADMHADTVDVWLRHVESGVTEPSAVDPRRDLVLSPSERQRACRYLSPVARRAFIEGRLFMRGVLGRYTATAPRDVGLEIAPRGKPFLADASSRIRFNLSHDSQWLVLAVSPSGDVGADVEALDRPVDVQAVAQIALAPRERARLQVCVDPTPTFFAYWTAKEAVAKAEGSGLLQDLRAIEFMQAPDALSDATIEARIAGGRTWWVRLLRLGKMHVAAIAFSRPRTVVRVFGSGESAAAPFVSAG